jgi:hypothetical protein
MNSREEPAGRADNYMTAAPIVSSGTTRHAPARCIQSADSVTGGIGAVLTLRWKTSGRE